tara:strand:+ start:1016 stop:1909 length:894 start_codon:yes stop_codon:yes gene_type:complete
MMSKKKIVYIGMAADLIHQGHINIIKKGQEYGKVIVGLLTDEAIAEYKRQPIIPFDQRMLMMKNLKGVKKVIPQKTLDYEENLVRLNPDVVIHGDDWKVGIQKKQREKVIQLLKKWNGKLIEPKYTKGISSTQIIKIIEKRIINSDEYDFIQLEKKKSNKKIVYAYFCLDIIHKGHIRAIKKHREIAGNEGELIAGILTDEAVKEKKRTPIISFEERFEIATSIKFIDRVIPQKTYSPVENIKRIKPNILIESSSHSTESIKLHQKLMDSLGGEVRVVPYYDGQSSTKIKETIKNSF